MPLTSKGRKIKSAMQKQYGKDRGERVFYATENKGDMKGLTKKKGYAMGGMVGDNTMKQTQYSVPQPNPYNMNKPMTMAKGGMVKCGASNPATQKGTKK